MSWHTCFGTSRLLWVFISAPVGVLDRVKVVRKRCMAVADGADRPGGLLGTKQTLCGNVVTAFMVALLLGMADDV